MSEIEGKEKNLRIVPAVIFIYDCFRFLFLITVLAFFLRPDPELRISKLPLIMYASPNALFLLMSFFLLIRFEASRPYIPLYAIGKFLCVLSMIIWLFFTLEAQRDLLFIQQFKEILWAMFLVAADLAAILGMVLQIEDAPQKSTMIAVSAAQAATVTQAAQPLVSAAEGGE